MTKLKRKPPNWMSCIVCGEHVAPGTGRVYYPLPLEQRRMLPVRLQAWMQGMKHDDCPIPAQEEGSDVSHNPADDDPNYGDYGP